MTGDGANAGREMNLPVAGLSNLPGASAGAADVPAPPAPPAPAVPPPAEVVDKYDAPRMVADQGPRRFHVMAKPAGSACNLDCAYCFYLSKETLAGGPGPGRMSEKVLEEFIRQYIEGVTGGQVVFSWQGGEPTLPGLDFYRRVVELEKKYARPGVRIENDLQTNGTLLDDAWCEFLKANRFLVGLSIDGPRELHDMYRVTKGGKPTFDVVMGAVRRLKAHGVPFNTLTCINRYNATRPLDVYRFLRRELGSTYMQFTPIVEYKGFERVAPHKWDEAALPRDGDERARPGTADSIVTDWSVDAEQWGKFLCSVFDQWRNNDLGKVLVNQFETLVSQHLGLGAQICIYGEICGKGLAIEHDGSVYSCDHYVYPEYRLGSIFGGTLTQMAFSRQQVKFGYAKSETLPQYCRKCPYLSDCWGECPKNRILRTPEGESGLNYLCRGFKAFYKHALPEIERIVAELRQQPQPLRPRARM